MKFGTGNILMRIKVEGRIISKKYSLSTDLPILSSVPFLNDFQSNSIDNWDLVIVILLLTGARNAIEELRHSATHRRIRVADVISKLFLMEN